jgi:mono/diheme cytochrome c family protein
VVAAASAETYRAVYNGWKWWHVYCYRCHGVNAVGATLAPDLLAANRKLTRAAFLRAVRIGRDEKGMPEWGSLLNARQMGDLFVYVRARADKVLAAGRPDEVGPKRGVWAPPPGWVAK